MFFQLYHELSEKGTRQPETHVWEKQILRQIPSSHCYKKKRCTMLEGTQLVSVDRNSDKRSQLKATGRTRTLLGQYYCLQSSVTLSSKKRLLYFLRSHGSLVTTETDKIQTLSCIVSEMPEDHTWRVLQLISWATTGILQNVKPSVFIKVSPLSKVVNTYNWKVYRLLPSVKWF